MSLSANKLEYTKIHYLLPSFSWFLKEILEAAKQKDKVWLFLNVLVQKA